MAAFCLSVLLFARFNCSTVELNRTRQGQVVPQLRSFHISENLLTKEDFTLHTLQLQLAHKFAFQCFDFQMLRTVHSSVPPLTVHKSHTLLDPCGFRFQLGCKTYDLATTFVEIDPAIPAYLCPCMTKVKELKGEIWIYQGMITFVCPLCEWNQSKWLREA